MAQNDLLKRYLDAGIAFTQLTQQKAEEIVRDLVHSGEVNTADARKRVEELLDRSKQNTEGIVAIVRSEVQKQLAQLRGQQAAPVVPTTPPATAAAKKAPAKKVVAKKVVAKKAPAKKTAAKKVVAKKAPAKKVVAKETVAKKTVAKKTAAKKVVAKKSAATKRA